jgi:hypothetical protein
MIMRKPATYQFEYLRRSDGVFFIGLKGPAVVCGRSR